MCGIAGLVGGRADPALVARMTATLHHRGPDDSGVHTEPGVAFGHTRLAILDLSPAGHQPMEFGDYVVTYNGEIYNFRELRRELPGPFRSDSDTEVLLHLYARDGARCVERLNGMFAFAIWDRRRRRLFAARDRLGIKPFHYSIEGDCLAFASELKALLALRRPALAPAALRDFLVYGYVPAPRTAYAGFAKLPAAHTLEWQDGRLRLARYWSPPDTVVRRDAASAREELGALLATVVTDHTLADVPVGVFLSGGLDSAAVASCLTRPETFTLGFDASPRSEAAAARRVAAHLGTRHHEATAHAIDMDAALAHMPGLYDEPFADSAAWSAYLISELARREVTVALSGEGGDELFCGYPRYWKSPGGGAGRHAAALLARLLPPLGPLGQSLERRALSGLESAAARLGYLNATQLDWLGAPHIAHADGDPLWFYRQHWREELEPRARLRWLDLHTNLPEGLLTKVDRASMAHSLEVRPPLLDHRLVEFACTLDTALLVDPAAGRGKQLVRELVAPRLPPGHLDRPKQGFGLPVRRWLRANPQLLAAASARLQSVGVLRRPIPAGFRGAWGLLVLDRWLAGNS